MDWMNFLIMGVSTPDDWGKNFWDTIAQPILLWGAIAVVGWRFIGALLKGSLAGIVGNLILGGIVLFFLGDPSDLGEIGRVLKGAVFGS